MILANFVTDFFTDALNGLAVAGALVFLAIYLVIAAIVALGRHIKRSTNEQGGIRKVGPKIVLGTAARYFGEALRKRLFG
jgi:hypothetical protein